MFRREVLDNGVRVVSERLPSVRSVSIGIWVDVGSRDERRGEEGLSHFIEHMVFKGTRRRSAEAISREIDALGGELNAFTSRECTTFYAKVLDEHMGPGIDLLADLFHHSRFDPKELTKEKQVVLDEIRMVEDDPEEFLHDLHTKNAYRAHPLGRPILGEAATIEALRRDQLVAYRAHHYRPSQIVVAVAGNFQFRPLLERLASAFGGRWGAGTAAGGRRPPTIRPGLHLRPKRLEQVHLCIGMKGVSQADPDRYAAYALNVILGGGVSSRLFQEVREKRGLAYSIYSSLQCFTDSGLMTVYAGARPDAAPRVLGLIQGELRRLRARPVGRAELARARSQMKGNLMLGLESTSSRMSKAAKDEIYLGRHIPLAEVMRAIDRVSADQLWRLSRDLFDDRYLTVTALGPLKKGTLEQVLE
ncbi:MAG TPA: pitrilysin family protein [Nitrospirales bacterium]|nr:pitrilysin family protein [Nitrospirales bacterium]